MKEKLQIFLITYNRKKLLEKTFEQLFAESSPIRDCVITILDNASTDGTSELIDEYGKKFPNIKHFRHKINIGGNANICRAFEMAATCNKEYAWILCDDDLYDFSNWGEVEENIEKKKDIICVSDYIFPSAECKNDNAYRIFQLTFVPSCIFRTDAITDSVLMNMYECIYTMFQQICLPAKVIKNGGDIHVLTKPIVFNGIHYKTENYDVSFTRGTTELSVTDRKRKTIWMLGYVNILTLLEDKNKEVIRDFIEIPVMFKDIHGSWEKFYKCLYTSYFNLQDFSYFYEIFKHLKFRRKLGFMLYALAGGIRFLRAVIKTIRFKLLFG